MKEAFLTLLMMQQIQQAAYELIPEAKRESFHLLLGSRIFLRTTPDELDKDLFTSE